MYDFASSMTRCVILVFLFFPGAFFHSRVTGNCPVTTDLIMTIKTRGNNNNYTQQVSSRPFATSAALPTCSLTPHIYFHTVWGGNDPGDHHFRPLVVEVDMYGISSTPEMVPCPPPVRRDLDVGPTGANLKARIFLFLRRTANLFSNDPAFLLFLTRTLGSALFVQNVLAMHCSRCPRGGSLEPVEWRLTFASGAQGVSLNGKFL